MEVSVAASQAALDVVTASQAVFVAASQAALVAASQAALAVLTASQAVPVAASQAALV